MPQPRPQNRWHGLVLGPGDTHTRPLVPPHALPGSLPSARGSPQLHKGEAPRNITQNGGVTQVGELRSPPGAPQKG